MTFNYSFSACHHQSASAGAREVTLLLPPIGRSGLVMFHNLRGSRVQCSRTCSLWYSPVLRLKEQSSVCTCLSIHSTSTRGAQWCGGEQLSCSQLHVSSSVRILWSLVPTLLFISCFIRFCCFVWEERQIVKLLLTWHSIIFPVNLFLDSPWIWC